MVAGLAVWVVWPYLPLIHVGLMPVMTKPSPAGPSRRHRYCFAFGVHRLGQSWCQFVKIFLSALAILDDMGAVANSLRFYTSNISLMMLGGAAAMVALRLA